MTKWQRCHGAMDACKQPQMEKRNNKNTTEGRSSKSHNRGRTTYKREYKVKMDDFQCEPPSYLFFKAPILGQTALSLFLLSNRWYTGRERVKESSAWFPPRRRRFLWDPQHKQTVFEIHLSSRSFTSSSFGTTYDMWFC